MRSSEPGKERRVTTKHTHNNNEQWWRRASARVRGNVRWESWTMGMLRSRATALLLLVASGSVDPRPAPNRQLVDKLEKLQGYGLPGPDMGALRTPHAVRARQG